jgi:methionine--tRNA ligase beta chain
VENITLADFQALDIRIGTVIAADIPPWSHWVMRLTVDFGSEFGQRIIFAGLINNYKVEEIKGKQFPFLINIEPKKIGPEGDFSHGMMLAAGDDRPYVLCLQEKVPNGTIVR